MYAKVLVDIKVKSLDRLFDYKIPMDQINLIEKGMRVIVPFGPQTRLGYVIDIVSESKNATKEIIDIIDVIPSIDEEVFIYLNYLQSKSKSILIDIVETILPSELFLKYYQEIVVVDDKKIPSHILELLSTNKATRYDNKLKENQKEINLLIKKGYLKINKVYEQKGKIKYIQTLSYNSNHSYLKADRYEELISVVKENESYTRAALTQEGFSSSSINTLIKNDVFKLNQTIENRFVNFKETNLIPDHILNYEQKNAYTKIKNSLNTYKAFLLKGVTGSGKTEVYMHLMKDVLDNKQNVLFLVPEITLIAPLIQQFTSRFKEQVIHYNSNLSAGERFDSYRAIINNEARIIVGTRSSVFLPINNLGIIIMDEEQDGSYNQNDKVQYQALDIVKLKAKYFNIPLVLGSATPKVSTMYDALNDKYELLELTKRATKQPLPKVTYVDMKDELKNGNTTIFSEYLKDSITKRIEKNEQVILLYNRKGYANFSFCRTCSYTPKCKNCDIALTYYEDSDELVCHYCNHKEKNIKICPSCNKETIRPVGVGIDQVVRITQKIFPTARIIKMDSNSTTKKGSHEQIWLDFKDEKYDILIGTQMVSKGLDFPKVSLVGILMADLQLKIPSYLATEETYNLLTQMVGRSGRKIDGEAVIQGYDLNNFAIKSVADSYEKFYSEAIYQRKISKYEPFYNVSQVLVKNKSYLKAYQDALSLKKNLVKYFEVVLGPSQPVIKYIKNEYRFIITIKDKKIEEEIIFKLIDDIKGESSIYYYKDSVII